jgi:hypothetical protein
MRLKKEEGIHKSSTRSNGHIVTGNIIFINFFNTKKEKDNENKKNMSKITYKTT